jgi:hypothetical protein
VVNSRPTKQGVVIEVKQWLAAGGADKATFMAGNKREGFEMAGEIATRAVAKRESLETASKGFFAERAAARSKAEPRRA